MARPLEGITGVSLEHAIAAPFCTRQLADQGARVIKVERRDVGDFARSYDQRVHGLSSHIVWTNVSGILKVPAAAMRESSKCAHNIIERCSRARS